MDAKITDQKKNVLQIRLKKKCSLLHLIASTIDQPLFGTGVGKIIHGPCLRWIVHKTMRKPTNEQIEKKKIL